MRGKRSMKDMIQKDQMYIHWIKDLKSKVRQIQLKAAVTVNTELLRFYWDLGAEIAEKEKATSWGVKFLPQLSKDLRAEFTDMRGFSLSNLKYIKQWYLVYNLSDTISQQLVGQKAVLPFLQIPWGHNIAIISKCNNVDEC
ncbi:MAG: DUF1016 family protein [Chitinivibrionales bacterium]|nr:DUF1016 family protein [Chitinivibrionales bacterium]